MEPSDSSWKRVEFSSTDHSSQEGIIPLVTGDLTVVEVKLLALIAPLTSSTRWSSYLIVGTLYKPLFESIVGRCDTPRWVISVSIMTFLALGRKIV